MSVQAQALFSGLATGAVYALLALGLVLMYRATRVLNLAHGEAFVLAGLVAYALDGTNLPLPLSLAAGVLAATVFSVAIELGLLRKRAHWPPGLLLLLTLGASFVARGAFLALFGTEARSFDRLLPGPGIELLGTLVSRQALLLTAVGVLVGVATAVVISRAKIGKRFTASAENPGAAQLLGINVPAVRVQAFAVGGALAGLGAVLVIPLGAVDYQSGLDFTLRGFIAAALGGLVSPWVAVGAGLGLGLFESVLSSYLGTLYRTPIVFAVLVAVALFQSRKIMFGGAQRA